MSKAQARRQRQKARREQAVLSADWESVWPDQEFGHIQVRLRDCGPGWVEQYMPKYRGCVTAPAVEVLSAAASEVSARIDAAAAVHKALLRSRKDDEL